MFTLADLMRAVGNETKHDYPVVVELDGTTVADGLHQDNIASIRVDDNAHKVIVSLTAE